MRSRRLRSAPPRVPRLAFTPEEAAEAIGVSRSSFYEHILADPRLVRVGRRRLASVKELERWLDRHTARVLDDF